MEKGGALSADIAREKGVPELTDMCAGEGIGGMADGAGDAAGDGDTASRAGELGPVNGGNEGTNPACMVSVESSGVRTGLYSSRGGFPVSPSSAASSVL